MKQTLLTTFAAPERALAAQANLDRLERCQTRVHRGEIEPVLSQALSGTSQQAAAEGAVMLRFGLMFGLCLAAGIALDLLHVVSDVGMPLTMALGSLGVFAGTIAVLADGAGPLDQALHEVDEAIGRGHVLLTVTVDDAVGDRVAATVSSYGGRTVIRA